MRLSTSRYIARFLVCLYALFVSTNVSLADDRDPLSAKRLNTPTQPAAISKALSCRDQASSRGLTRGDARHNFLQQCLAHKKAQRLEREENCRSQNATLPSATARRQAFKRCLDKNR